MQNFTQKDLTEVKIFQKVLRGLLFLKHPVDELGIDVEGDIAVYITRVIDVVVIILMTLSPLVTYCNTHRQLQILLRCYKLELNASR